MNQKNRYYDTCQNRMQLKIAQNTCCKRNKMLKEVRSSGNIYGRKWADYV